MKKVCVDGTEISYRLPNVIELLELKNEAGWGRENVTGHGMIAGILKNCAQFIEKVKGKKDWSECLNTRYLTEDLSEIALSLIKDELEPEEKKS